MRGHPLPLLVGKLTTFLEQIEWHARLADVVHKRGESQLVELELRHAEAAAKRDRKDANVDRMGERVFVVVADRGQADERRLLVQNLVDDALHHSLDFADVGRLADSDRVDDILRHRHRLRVGAIGGCLCLFVEFLVARCLRRGVELKRLDLWLPGMDGYQLAVRLRAEERQQKAPVAGAAFGADVNRPDACQLGQREDVAEGRVVAQIETKASFVQEDKLARDPEFQIPFLGAELLRHLCQLGKCLLHGAVLERVKLDRAQCSVERDHEVPSPAPDVRTGLFLGVGARFRCRGGHAPPPRIALLTAFLTITSFSPVARLRDSAAFAVLIFPSAIAAQALNSESSFFPMNPLALRMPSKRGIPASPQRSP